MAYIHKDVPLRLAISDPDFRCQTLIRPYSPPVMMRL